MIDEIRERNPVYTGCRCTQNVQRRNYNADDSRRENTAEHSWQIVILAQILYPYAKNKEQVDLLRVIRMLSIHDLVEINAGDTFLLMKK